jgi:hypothetical protein
MNAKENLVFYWSACYKYYYSQLKIVSQTRFYEKQLINSMELSPSWEVASLLATQEFPSTFYGTQEPSAGPYPEPAHPIPCRIILFP